MPRDSQKLDLYISEKGICVLLVWSQQPLTKELPEYMGIKIIGYKQVHKEAATIDTMQKVFEGVLMNPQVSIGS